MLKCIQAVSAVALIAGASVPSLAQASSASQAAQPATAAPAVNSNEVICQKQEVIGSRLATKRVCKTRQEWADAQLQDRQEVERVQTQRGMKPR